MVFGYFLGLVARRPNVAYADAVNREGFPTRQQQQIPGQPQPHSPEDEQPPRARGTGEESQPSTPAQLKRDNRKIAASIDRSEHHTWTKPMITALFRSFAEGGGGS